MSTRSFLFYLTLAVSSLSLLADPAQVKVLISAESTNTARINPKLFGNFIELLEDVVPGTWAEMLNDRSFEGVTRPANWCYYDGSLTICDRQWDNSQTWNIDTSNPFNGKRSAKLTSTDLLPASLTQSGLSVNKGMDYHFSGYLRADAATTKCGVVLKTLLPDGTWMQLASAALPTISRDWQRYSLDLVSSGTTDRAVFDLRSEGQGAVWADKLSLMPADNLRGWRGDVIQAIKEVRPGVVRWGGSACDPGEYRWKNGIGDRDHRVPFPNKVWGRIDSNDVGIDEFCEFCALVEAEPLVCLSFSDGPQSAANLVEYCNGGPQTRWGAKRAANGHPAAYHVKYWQVGNEISGDNQEYFERFGEFARLMKAKDPSLSLCSSFPSRKFIERFARDLAFICPHHYTTDFGFCDRELTDLTRMLESTRGCEQTRIAVTEWNVSGGDWGLMRGRQMTLQAGLLNARYLNLLMRHARRVEMACRSNLANSFCGAVIETSPSGVLKRPSYHVMRLYANHAKPIPLPMMQSADTLDLFGCASENNSSVALFAVNQATEPVKTSLEFQGFAKPVHIANAEAVCDILDARQPDVVNHWGDASERVGTRSLRTGQNDIVVPALSVVAVECAAF
jgi:alpha-L-arabinofuranosidase